MAKLNLKKISDFRKKKGCNQIAFWSELGVSQSGASRYENGQAIPVPVAMLLMLREAGKLSQADLHSAKTAIHKQAKEG